MTFVTLVPMVTGPAVAFWLLAPVMVLAAIGMILSRKPVHSALCLATVLPTAWAVKQLAATSLDVVPVAVAFVVGLTCGVLFVRRQRSVASPMLRLELLHDRRIAAVLLAMVVTGACLSALGWLSQPLAQKEALVVGRPVELAEHFVAERPIEARSLEAEGVEPSRVATTLQRPALGLLDELASDPLAAQTFRHPEIPDEEPASIGFPGEARDDVSVPIIAHEDAERLPGLMTRPLALVEGFQPMRQRLHVGVRRLVLNIEAQAGGKTHERTSSEAAHAAAPSRSEAISVG